MIHSKFRQAVMTLMPLLAITSSFSLVFYENWHRDALTAQLAATDKEYSKYSRRYMELWRAEQAHKLKVSSTESRNH